MPLLPLVATEASDTTFKRQWVGEVAGLGAACSAGWAEAGLRGPGGIFLDVALSLFLVIGCCAWGGMRMGQQ